MKLREISTHRVIEMQGGRDRVEAKAPGNAGDRAHARIERWLTTRDPNGKQQGAESQMEGRRETGDEPVRANQRKQLDWVNVDWNRVKCQVEKMQQEIFRDAQTGNLREMKQKQKLLVRSLSARLWAVRLVT